VREKKIEEVKPVEVDEVEKWKVEKILNKKNKRSYKVLSIIKEVYSRV